MKSNFNLNKNNPPSKIPKMDNELTEEEFEEYLQKLPKGWNLWNIRSQNIE
jgi:hypothetical protein